MSHNEPKKSRKKHKQPKYIRLRPVSHKETRRATKNHNETQWAIIKHTCYNEPPGSTISNKELKLATTSYNELPIKNEPTVCSCKKWEKIIDICISKNWQFVWNWSKYHAQNN